MAQFSHLGITAVKTLSTAQVLTNSVNSFSNSVELIVWAGFAAIEISANAATATITQQCSSDNVNWYDAVDKTGAAIGAIATGLSTTAYIEFDPVLTKYFRLKYVPTGTGAITAKLIIVE